MQAVWNDGIWRKTKPTRYLCSFWSWWAPVGPSFFSDNWLLPCLVKPKDINKINKVFHIWLLTWWAPKCASFVSECGSKVIKVKVQLGSLWIWKLGELQRALVTSQNDGVENAELGGKTKPTRYFLAQLWVSKLGELQWAQVVFQTIDFRGVW